MSGTDRSLPHDITPALIDAVTLFDRLGIGYALIGGIAAMMYGRSRFTEDADFIADADHESVLSAHPDDMRACGFDPGSTWKLYHRSGIEIDLWKDEHAAEIVRRARSVEIDGRPVKIADPHDLIAMKLRADRPHDDADIADIVRGTPIDDADVRGRVTAEQFDRYQAIKRRVGL